LFPAAAAAAAHKPWQGTKGECERVERSRKKKKKTRKDAHIMLAAVDTICKRNAEEKKQSNATKLEHKKKQRYTQQLQTIN
jgi:hypothetical protein